MNIKVSDKTLGDCTITIKNKIDKQSEYMIKALCVLQIMCMNKKQDPEKFEEFTNIINDATEKIEKLFSEEINNIEEGTLNGTEDFYS